MGGRGNMKNPPSARVQEYKAVGNIAGIKVLERLQGKPALPIMSNTPGTGYIRLKDDKSGIEVYREYSNNRLAVLDIDFGHDHGHGIPHIHFWDKRGKDRDKNARPLSSQERKKYAKLLKATGYI